MTDELTPAVAVVGAGPAGLSAAVAALDRDADVVVLDSAGGTGGQYWRHPPADRAVADPALGQHDWSLYTRLHDRVTTDPRCTVLTDAEVWAISAEGNRPVLHVLQGTSDGPGRTGLVVRPGALVLATGAHDRTLPFPGWDLPGVVTGGAAQSLAKAERVPIGRRVLVAGSGPFLLPVATSLAAVGARVVEIAEAGRPGTLARGWLRNPWQLIGAAGKGRELAGYAAGLLRQRVPYRTGCGVIAAHGTDVVEAVTLADLDARWSPIPGTERRVEVDAVAVTHGFTPRLELPIAAGCRITRRGTVAVDGSMRTSAPGVYAAGEVTGIGGMPTAVAEGRIAGTVAAGGEPGRDDLRELRRTHDFADRLERAHAIRPGWRDQVTDDTLVCRCEEVRAGELGRFAAAGGSPGARALRLASRTGLGICQGRICARNTADLIDAAGNDRPDPSRSERRPVATPIRLGELAALTTPEPDSQTRLAPESGQE